MRIRNQEAWDRQVKGASSLCSAGCVRYAEAWANAMEAKLREGTVIADIAKDTSHEADTEGVTGVMYGRTVAMLAECWEYGEELRLWHNRTTQIGTEGDKANESGGVLNPAVISISPLTPAPEGAE